MEDPQSTPFETLDVLEITNSPEFTGAVQQANDRLHSHTLSDAELDEMTHDIEAELTDYLDPTTENRIASITGFVYEVDENGVTKGEVTYFSNEDVLFTKLTVAKLAHLPTVVCLFETAEYTDENGYSHESKVYLTEPTSLTKFEIYDFNFENVYETLTRHAMQSRGVTSDPDFFELSIDDQYEYLEADGNMIEDELELAIGDTIDVEANRFIVQFEDMPRPLSDCVTDQTNLKPEVKYTITGTYEAVTYIELTSRDKAFKGAADFPISGGLPCLIVKDESRGATFSIPIDKVITIK